MIAHIAKTDVEPAIRQAATKKLTSQDTLGWITINDPTPMVRSTAAELMTDVSALVKAAAVPPVDSFPQPPQTVAEEAPTQENVFEELNAVAAAAEF